MERPLTAQEAADQLGYNIDHLYLLLKKGTIRGERFNKAWMIDPAEVERIATPSDSCSSGAMRAV